MTQLIGPLSLEKLVLCSADASPNSQSETPKRAAYFFPGAKWVGATRNAARSIGCRFVVPTTGHGLVDGDELIDRYDVHILSDPLFVDVQWRKTIPRVLSRDECEMLVFYTGGCPREPYIEMLWPKLRAIGIALLAFGKPNMGDAGHIRDVVHRLIRGTSLNELRGVVKFPEFLDFYGV